MIQEELERLARYSYDRGSSDTKQAIVMAIKQFADIASRAGRKSEYVIYTDLAKAIDTIQLSGYLGEDTNENVA